MVTRTRLSDADRALLAAKIKQREARTTAELVLVIADRCGSYGLFAFLWPALASLIAGGLAASVAPQVSAGRVFLIEAGIFAFLVAVLHYQPLLLRVVPRQIRHVHAQHVAAHQFERRIQGRTPDRTGVLLFVALAERQVFILPDSEISARVDSSAWRAVVDQLLKSLLARSPVEGLDAAIAEIFAVLESHFAAGSAPTGRLPDTVIELDTEPETVFETKPPRG